MSLAGRPSQRQRRVLATGGRPRERLAAVLLANFDAGETKPGMNIVQVHHDDGCPCLDGRGMGACTCEVVEVAKPVVVSNAADLREYLKERRAR